MPPWPKDFLDSGSVLRAVRNDLQEGHSGRAEGETRNPESTLTLSTVVNIFPGFRISATRFPE